MEVSKIKTSTTSERLKQIMEENHLRQIDILNKCQPFCKKYGVKLGRNDLSQYVHGKVIPGQEKLSVLGLALNVSEAWLMGYDVPKYRDSIVHVAHQDFSDDILYAISVLASCSGYNFQIFANQYQIEYEDCIIKLSPEEIMDYKKTSVEKIQFVTENIIKNKLHDNIFSISQDFVNAACDQGATTVQKKLADHIMEDPHEWE